jgi:DMSO/TMAO reductase YedYZ heme-binding membrane subunit
MYLCAKLIYTLIYLFCRRTACGGRPAVKEGIAAMVLMQTGTSTSTGWVNRRKQNWGKVQSMA